MSNSLSSVLPPVHAAASPIRMHASIIAMFETFLADKRVPHLLLHGPRGSGKRSLMDLLLDKIYQCNKIHIQENVMTVNCTHGKGIKFIREEVKFFAKVNMSVHIPFKSILLLNADALTLDAQSALRRVIEQHSHTTRFFMIVESKHSMIKPILSRFCDVFVPPFRNGNLHAFQLQSTQSVVSAVETQLQHELAQLHSLSRPLEIADCIKCSERCYAAGGSAWTMIRVLQTMYPWILSSEDRLWFEETRTSIRDEPLLMLALLTRVLFLT
jgi:hypothetical protein